MAEAGNADAMSDGWVSSKVKGEGDYRLEPELADFIAQAMSVTQQLLETGRVIGGPRKWSCPRRRSSSSYETESSKNFQRVCLSR